MRKHTPEIRIFQGYCVTREGQIHGGWTNWRGKGPRPMTMHLNSHGYLRVRLASPGNPRERKSYFVHKLMAELFHGPKPSPEHEVCHINGDRTDNRADNLRWGTRAENAADRERHGHTSRGEKHSDSIRMALSESKRKYAHLIAAAPDLLEALKACQSRLFAETAAENQPWGVRLIEQVSAAIAKAEGRS